MQKIISLSKSEDLVERKEDLGSRYEQGTARIRDKVMDCLRDYCRGAFAWGFYPNETPDGVDIDRISDRESDPRFGITSIWYSNLKSLIETVGSILTLPEDKAYFDYLKVHLMDRLESKYTRPRSDTDVSISDEVEPGDHREVEGEGEEVSSRNDIFLFGSPLADTSKAAIEACDYAFTMLLKKNTKDREAYGRVWDGFDFSFLGTGFCPGIDDKHKKSKLMFLNGIWAEDDFLDTLFSKINKAAIEYMQGEFVQEIFDCDLAQMKSEQKPTIISHAGKTLEFLDGVVSKFKGLKELHSDRIACIRTAVEDIQTKNKKEFEEKEESKEPFCEFSEKEILELMNIIRGDLYALEDSVTNYVESVSQKINVDIYQNTQPGPPKYKIKLKSSPKVVEVESSDKEDVEKKLEDNSIEGYELLKYGQTNNIFQRFAFIMDNLEDIDGIDQCFDEEQLEEATQQFQSIRELFCIKSTMVMLSTLMKRNLYVKTFEDEAQGGDNLVKTGKLKEPKELRIEFVESCIRFSQSLYKEYEQAWIDLSEPMEVAFDLERFMEKLFNNARELYGDMYDGTVLSDISDKKKEFRERAVTSVVAWVFKEGLKKPIYDFRDMRHGAGAVGDCIRFSRIMLGVYSFSQKTASDREFFSICESLEKHQSTQVCNANDGGRSGVKELMGGAVEGNACYYDPSESTFDLYKKMEEVMEEYILFLKQDNTAIQRLYKIIQKDIQKIEGKMDLEADETTDHIKEVLRKKIKLFFIHFSFSRQHNLWNQSTRNYEFPISKLMTALENKLEFLGMAPDDFYSKLVQIENEAHSESIIKQLIKFLDKDPKSRTLDENNNICLFGKRLVDVLNQGHESLRRQFYKTHIDDKVEEGLAIDGTSFLRELCKKYDFNLAQQFQRYVSSLQDEFCSPRIVSVPQDLSKIQDLNLGHGAFRGVTRTISNPSSDEKARPESTTREISEATYFNAALQEGYEGLRRMLDKEFNVIMDFLKKEKTKKDDEFETILSQIKFPSVSNDITDKEYKLLWNNLRESKSKSNFLSKKSELLKAIGIIDCFKKAIATGSLGTELLEEERNGLIDKYNKSFNLMKEQEQLGRNRVFNFESLLKYIEVQNSKKNRRHTRRGRRNSELSPPSNKGRVDWSLWRSK